MANFTVADNPIQNVLGRIIIDRPPYIYIDHWSLVHFSSGLILGLLFAAYYRGRFAWRWVFALLVFYEILEIFLTDFLFVSEGIPDKFWDLIVGLAGFFIFYGILRKKNNQTGEPAANN